jgi:hypothetical protein
VILPEVNLALNNPYSLEYTIGIPKAPVGGTELDSFIGP